MKCDRFASMLLILCMVLAGCTGPAAPEAGATAAEQPAPEATAAKEAELVTMLVFPPDDVALYAEAFTEQTQVEIEFADAAGIADSFVAGRTIVLDLGAADKITARRVIDFLSGVAYARGGSLSRISGGVYLVTPAGVNITGEMMSQIESGGLYF